MSKPKIGHVQMDCEECDIYDPTEGNCRECLQKNAMNTCGHCFWFDPKTSRCVADAFPVRVNANDEACETFIKAPKIIHRKKDGEQER